MVVYWEWEVKLKFGKRFDREITLEDEKAFKKFDEMLIDALNVMEGHGFAVSDLHIANEAPIAKRIITNC